MSHNSNQPLTADHEWNMSELTFLLLIEVFVKLYMFSRLSSLLTTVCDGSKVLLVCLPAGVCLLMYSIPSLGSSLEPTCMPLQVLQSHVLPKNGENSAGFKNTFFSKLSENLKVFIYFTHQFLSFLQQRIKVYPQSEQCLIFLDFECVFHPLQALKLSQHGFLSACVDWIKSHL